MSRPGSKVRAVISGVILPIMSVAAEVNGPDHMIMAGSGFHCGRFCAYGAYKCEVPPHRQVQGLFGRIGKHGVDSLCILYHAVFFKGTHDNMIDTKGAEVASRDKVGGTGFEQL